MSYEVIRPLGAGNFILICDHASNYIPAELNSLGLAPQELARHISRHIAWDIGAAGITRELSSIFDAPAVLTTTSRLVVDCNRHLDANDLIPESSDGTRIPGNVGLSRELRAARVERWFHPYHAAIESLIEGRIAQGADPVVISIHSMTENLGGSARPWQIAMSSASDRSLADPVLSALRRPGDIVVGDNEPYDLDPAVDFSVPFHAMRRGLRHLQVEFRQDEVAEASAQLWWARLFAGAVAEVLSVLSDDRF